MYVSDKHPFILTATDINEICKPLEKININLFTFMRSYPDRSRIYLSNNPKWVKDYYNLELFKSSNFEFYAEHSISKILLWPLINEDETEVYKHGKIYFNSYYGLTVIKHTKEFCEYYFFSTNINNPSIINSFLNNLEIFEKFIEYFNYKLQTSIHKLQKSKIIIPEMIIDKNSVYENKKQDYVKRELLTELNCLTVNNNASYLTLSELTRTEQKIFSELLQGKAAKEISEKYCRSVRTIEKHIENIKDKLRCNKISKLLLKYPNYNIAPFK